MREMLGRECENLSMFKRAAKRERRSAAGVDPVLRYAGHNAAMFAV
jgi:hypothetical protein